VINQPTAVFNPASPCAKRYPDGHAAATQDAQREAYAVIAATARAVRTAWDSETRS
jgi:hypothetical protein